MFSTKVRRQIIFALAASASIGVAPVAPAVSQAQIALQGDWQTLGHVIYCESLATGYKAYREEAEAAERQGEILLATAYWKAAANYIGEEASEDCPLVTYPTHTPVVGSLAPPRP
jgi:hypothetical protein